jgi:BlaI family transcriptional regulator, penicillinase repressor
MPPTEKLSRREREIMDVLYALGDTASADSIQERLSDPPSYSAVRAMLVRLEAKGFIRHRAEGLRYVYAPTRSREAARKKAVGQLMRVFFGGSASEAAAALLKEEQWSDAELVALRAQIEQVRRNRRQP